MLGIKLVIDTKVHIDKDNRIVVVVYIDDILIATKESIHKHRRQVSNVFQLSMGYNMGVEIDKCIFDAQETSLLGCIVSGTGLRMDPEKATSIVDWPHPTS